MVELSVLALRSSPLFPAVGFVEDEAVLLALQRRLSSLVLFQPVEVFQEQELGSLLGVVKFCGASRLFSENVVDVFEGLFEHGNLSNICFFSQLSKAIS